MYPVLFYFLFFVFLFLAGNLVDKSGSESVNLLVILVLG